VAKLVAYFSGDEKKKDNASPSTTVAANGKAASPVPAVAAAAPKVKADAATRAQQMCLFDIETNIFPIEVIEFGAIVVDKFSFVESSPRVSTLIRPPSGAISAKATACHGLTYADVKDAPAFAEVAARIHDALDGRIWVGHNINTFDVPHLRAAFEAANHPMPVPAGVLDTLPLVRRVFGKRAGDAKMATLGRYFGFGEEKHRAVEDCEMTLQVLKSVALGALLEQELPALFPKFVEEKKEKAEKPAAAAKKAEKPAAAAADAKAASPAPASVPAADAAVEALTTQVKDLSVEEKKQPKQRKKKNAAAPAAATGGFIDPSLLSSAPAATEPAAVSPPAAAAAPASAAPAASAARPAAAAAASQDDEWHVAASKKTHKQEKLQQQHQQKHAGQKKEKTATASAGKQKQPHRERVSSAGANQNGAAQQQHHQQQQQAAAPAPSIWVKLAAGARGAASAPTSSPASAPASSAAAKAPAQSLASASAAAPAESTPSTESAQAAVSAPATEVPAAAAPAAVAAPAPAAAPAPVAAPAPSKPAVTVRDVSASPVLAPSKSPLSAAAPSFRPSVPNTPISGSPVIRPAQAPAAAAAPEAKPLSAWGKPAGAATAEASAAAAAADGESPSSADGAAPGSPNPRRHKRLPQDSPNRPPAISSNFIPAEQLSGPVSGAYLSLSPEELRALEGAIDVYVADQSLACALQYNGGKKPGRVHTIKELQWVKRPRTFQAVIHGSKYGPTPVLWSTAKVISLQRINL